LSCFWGHGVRRQPYPCSALLRQEKTRVRLESLTHATDTARFNTSLPSRILRGSLKQGTCRMPHLLGIDIGTSGTKTLICDEDGAVLATAMAEHPIFSPKPGWSEQAPEDWWQATIIATKAVLKKAKIKAAEVSAIGLSGQMHGSVFLGDGTKALRPALLWNDQRTARQCAEITAKAGGRDRLIEMVGNPALTGFTAPKILWVRENEPKIYEKTRHILLPKDYIRYRMTDEYATEVGDASGTLLFDVANRGWSAELSPDRCATPPAPAASTRFAASSPRSRPRVPQR